MPHLEDLLAQWWRESYPKVTLHSPTAALMVAFAQHVLDHHTPTPTPTPTTDGPG